MVHYLFSNRGRIQQTNSAISTLTFYSVNCGALNIVCTAAAIACLVQLPQALIWTLFFVCQSKLYFCSFMAILNSREYIRELLHDPGSLMTETHPCHLAKGTEHAAASETTTTNSSTSTGV
ncbi:hypothetical protein BC834DRAFT_908248 [Gloeopeniophorella convolvens]|nr:hypothetical protein BC834DRAFT_908248 [Gloeopeniophorella convolvens]